MNFNEHFFSCSFAMQKKNQTKTEDLQLLGPNLDTSNAQCKCHSISPGCLCLHFSISVDFATYAVFLPHAAANSSLLSVANLPNVPTVEPFVSPAKYSLTWRANFVGKQSSVLASAKSLLSIKFKFTYLHI